MFGHLCEPGLTRITFAGYTHDQLIKIIRSRLSDETADIFEPDAIQFASRKIAAVSGDARRALDICRRAVELAESSTIQAVGTSKAGKDDETSGHRKTPRVTIGTIKRAIDEATSSPVQQHLRSLPVLVKVTLMAIVGRLRRTGLAETTVGEAMNELGRIAGPSLGKGRLANVPALSGMVKAAGDPSLDKAANDVFLMGIVRAALTELAAAGIVTLEAQRAERPSKLRMAVGVEEVKMAYRNDEDVQALGLQVD